MAGWIWVISQSPTAIEGMARGASALHQFAAALEELGGVFHQLAPALEHFAAGVGDVLALLGGVIAALLRLIGDVAAGIFAALRRIQHGHGGANYRTRQEPGEAVRTIVVVCVFQLFEFFV